MFVLYCCFCVVFCFVIRVVCSMFWFVFVMFLFVIDVIVKFDNLSSLSWEELWAIAIGFLGSCFWMVYCEVKEVVKFWDIWWVAWACLFRKLVACFEAVAFFIETIAFDLSLLFWDEFLTIVLLVVGSICCVMKGRVEDTLMLWDTW